MTIVAAGFAGALASAASVSLPEFSIPANAQQVIFGWFDKSNGAFVDFVSATVDASATGVTPVLVPLDDGAGLTGLWTFDCSALGSTTLNIVVTTDNSGSENNLVACYVTGNNVTVRAGSPGVGSTGAAASQTLATEVGDTVISFLSARDFFTASGNITAGSGQSLIGELNGGAGDRLSMLWTQTATGTSTNSDFSWVGDRKYSEILVALYESSPPATVTMTDVDTDEIITNGQTGIVITGTNFEAVQGAGSVTIDNVTQTVTNWTDTAVTITHVLGVMQFGAQTLTVTNDSASSNNIAITVNPAAGYTYVDVTSIAGGGITATPSLAAGDQLEYESTTTPTGHAVTVFADTTFSIGGDPAGESFDVRAWDSSSPSWGAYAAQSVSANVAPTLPTDQILNVLEGTTVVNNTSTATAGTAPITYSPSGTDQTSFDINSNTGALTFTNAPDFETKNSYLVTVTGTNTFGNDSQLVTVNITNVNEEIIVDGDNASEEFPNGDAGLPKTSPLFINWLALFTNATGNNSASLPAILTVAGSPYSVTFTLNDADDLIRTFSVTEQAQVAPTDITLSSTSVSVSGGVNAVVGTLTTTDANINDTHTYTLEAGTGDADNSSFGISGNQLTCNDPAALGLGTYSVRVQTSDGTNTYQEAFTISVVAAGVASAGHQNITANDAVVYTNMVGLYVGGSGNVVAEINGVEATYYAVPTGTILPGYFSVIKTSTTATNLVALFG